MNTEKIWLFSARLPPPLSTVSPLTDVGRGLPLGSRFVLRSLVGLLLLLVSALALAQVPIYTLVDLGSADAPNGTAWPDADCVGTAAGTDAQGHPLYSCQSWDSPRRGGANAYLDVAVGYALLAPNQPQPFESYASCCSEPPPYAGLNALPLPPALQGFAAEAISLSEGGEYVVGYAEHQGVRNALLWDAEIPYELPALSGNGIQYDSDAYSVNESGEVVGESLIPLTAGGSALRATVWIAHAPHELQYMLSPYVPVILTTARWIDCAGNIGAQGEPIGADPPYLDSNYPHNYLLIRQGAARSSCGS